MSDWVKRKRVREREGEREGNENTINQKRVHRMMSIELQEVEKKQKRKKNIKKWPRLGV